MAGANQDLERGCAGLGKPKRYPACRSSIAAYQPSGFFLVGYITYPFTGNQLIAWFPPSLAFAGRKSLTRRLRIYRGIDPNGIMFLVFPNDQPILSRSCLLYIYRCSFLPERRAGIASSHSLGIHKDCFSSPFSTFHY